MRSVVFSSVALFTPPLQLCQSTGFQTRPRHDPLIVAPGMPQEMVNPEAAAAITEPGQIQQMLARESSLAGALDGARRAVQSLTAAESRLPENAGTRFFAAHPGQQLTARFREGDMVLASGR